MRSSYPQTDEPNYFPELWILKSAYKIKYVLKFDSSEACKGKKAVVYGRLVRGLVQP